MKAELYFYGDPLEEDDRSPEEKRMVNESLLKKVHNKLITLPCMPTKEMKINIESFADVYGFTKLEMKWITDANRYYDILDIFVEQDRIVIWVKLWNWSYDEKYS